MLNVRYAKDGPLGLGMPGFGARVSPPIMIYDKDAWAKASASE